MYAIVYSASSSGADQAVIPCQTETAEPTANRPKATSVVKVIVRRTSWGMSLTSSATSTPSARTAQTLISRNRWTARSLGSGRPPMPEKYHPGACPRADAANWGRGSGRAMI